MPHRASRPERTGASTSTRAGHRLAHGWRLTRAGIARISSSPRLRGEVGWVVAHRSIELLFLFALLKILTSSLGREGYGEYNLAETALMLIGSVLIAPVFEAYKRDYHASREPAARRAAATTLIRWYAIATLGTAIVLGVSSASVAERLSFGSWTVLAAGLVFVGERWRLLGHEWLNLERQRRAGALWNLGFLTTQAAAIAAVVTFGPATPTAALLAYAGASLAFGTLVAGPTLRDLLRLPAGARSRIPGLVWSFGLPFAALQLSHWLQSFADRYLVKGLLDPASVGLYVAAYQVCGIPFVLAQRIAHELLIPIAYQRSRDADDPVQLWSADRVILAGLGAQIAVGIGMLAFYALFGSRLLVLLTSDEYALPSSMIVILATGRFAQAISLSLQSIFAVHQRMQRLIWFRGIGAALTPALCWILISHWGLAGAATGSMLSFLGYLLIITFGPGGGLWLVTNARRGIRETADREARRRSR